MKKLMTALCLILVFSMLLSPVASAAGPNTDTLADWDLKITVPEGKTAVLKGSEYYIYGAKEGSIPYVMVRMYSYDSAEKFIEDFTAYMQKQYKDLRVTAEAAEKTVGGRRCLEIDYTYKVQNYDVQDRRVVVTVGDKTYMFASKEVASIGLTLGDMLDQVVAGCEFLADFHEEEPVIPAPAPGSAPEAAPDLSVAPGYLYCLEDGMPKYWLDFTGTYAENPVLHCWFRSGEPTFYESLLILDVFTAELDTDTILFKDITDNYGFDHSAKYKKLAIREDNGSVILEVERDESTLAGGPDDNLLTGTYRMEPVGVHAGYEYRSDGDVLRCRLIPGEESLTLHIPYLNLEGKNEAVFTIDPKSAELDWFGKLRVGKLLDEDGNDVSEYFHYMTLLQTDDGIQLDVEWDEDAPLSGPLGMIPEGGTTFKPFSRLRPLSDGPFEPAELCRWARVRYFEQTGFYPPEADFELNADDTCTVHLYEIVDTDGFLHTATCAWYTLDEYGVGYDDIFGDEVRLAA